MNMTNKQKEIPSGHIDVEFKREILIAGVKTKSVRMREPTVGDHLAAEEAKGGGSAVEIALLANLCMLAPDDIHKLPLREYKQLQAAVSLFID